MTNNKYNIDDILDELEIQVNDCLTKESFYTTYDDRVLESYIEDIDGGDNFVDYCKEFFELLEEEGYYD